MRLPLLLPLAFILHAHAGDWPNWRGPNFDGSSSETSLPDKITPENTLWKVPMPGPAASTPVVSGDHVFVSTTDEAGKKLLGIALDRKTGTELWRKELGTGFSADEMSNFAK